MCSPCGPMVCYKYEDCGPPKGKAFESTSKAEEGGAEKKDEKENQLKRTKSRELRGGVMYYSCHCIKRNGLQHDCRRTGCGGEPTCLVLPDPVCAPSQLARARGLADPAPFAAHLSAQSGGGSGVADSGSSGGKRFIVCELKGILPDVASDKGGKCCKCLVTAEVPRRSSAFASVNVAKPLYSPDVCKGSCTSNSSKAYTQSSLLEFDEKTIATILKRFESKESAPSNVVVGPGGRIRKTVKPVHKEEPCTRPGCMHWQPPPPCVWNAPCKADCFETLSGIQPGHNLKGTGASQQLGHSNNVLRESHRTVEKIKLLMPECCTGCSASGVGGGTSSDGSHAAGLPVLVMKLC
ncbi:unnamed protein product [Chilo suppressalis]|uniref:Uncharacterized protein n=1 Tax=Chilo suppressalis TaxID=168631 RepID=A0ABN8L6X3_CHISP|nr:unnamed protein product [Chilo suppressalis]